MPELVENEARLLTNAGILAATMGIQLSRVLSFLYVYVCLSASWYLEDNQYPEFLRIAELVEPHIHG
jgi:streptomycin 6-kinase